MKNASKLVFGKDAKLSLMIALAALAFVALACGGGSGSSSKNKPLSSDYHGSWTASDGTTLRITSDGLGYYKSGGTTVDGAAAELDETGKILKLSFLGVAVKEFKIDQEPKNGGMKLDGVQYKTADFTGSKTGSDDDDSKSAPGEAPSKSELDAKVKDITEKFNDAVQEEDFTNLRDEYTAEAFKKQFSAEKMKDIFKDFIAQKEGFDKHFKSISNMTPTYSTEPKVTTISGQKVLKVEGTYASKPETVFTFQFVDEDGEWKLMQLKYNVGK